jgi:hypothetical protein
VTHNYTTNNDIDDFTGAEGTPDMSRWRKPPVAV